MPNRCWAARARSRCRPKRHRSCGRHGRGLVSWSPRLRHDEAMRYAYLGPEGPFSESACASLSGSQRPEDVEPVPCASIGAALAAVRTGDAERAVVPIESSVEGIVTATVD